MSAAWARKGSTACTTVALGGLWALVCAAQQNIPPAATTGGAQPRPTPDIVTDEALVPFEIPRVPERPLGVDEGPRVHVKRFEVFGAATQPDVPAAEVDAVLAAALTEQPPEGYSVNQLQLVADRVAERYRHHGLILVQAVIPAQDVVNGVVNILVLDGALADVRFEGQRMYSPRTLARPFKQLLSRPVRNDSLEAALLTLTDYPGLSAFGVFQAGKRIGTTDLVIKTQHEDRWTLDTSLDNQGSQFSGEYRANLALTLNDPLGQADRLKLFGLYAFDPSDSDSKGVYGGFDYRLPVFSPRHELQFGYSHNLFEVGKLLRQLGIQGTTDIAQITYDRTLSKTRLGDMTLQLGLTRKDARFEQQGTVTAKDVLAVGNLGFQWSRIGLRSRGITQLSANYSHGFSDMFGSLVGYDEQPGVRASRLGAGGSFDKLTMQVQRFQRLAQNHALLLRLSGQYSDDLLVSLEQFSIGGPDTVRAYPSAEFLADTGGFASLEWIVNAPGFAARPAFGGRTWGQIFQASLFVDYATGRLNETLPGELQQIDLSGWGVGLQLSIPNRFFVRLDVAKPIGSAVPSNDRDPQYFFRLGSSL